MSDRRQQRRRLKRRIGLVRALLRSKVEEGAEGTKWRVRVCKRRAVAIVPRVERRGEALEREAEAAAEEGAAAAETEERARTAAMDQKAIDERVGYEKRYDRTKEDFRKKEERKRENGQQNRDGNWVEEEKRKLRHGATNFDS